MSLARSIVAALALCFTALLTAPAQAQVTLGQTVQWSTGDRAGIKDTEINREDCLRDAQITFTMTHAGANNSLFQIWAGAGCGTLQTRTDHTTCFLVADVENGATQVTVPVRTLVQTASTTAGPGAGESACDGGSSEGAIERHLFFLLINPGTLDNDSTTNPEWTFFYDVTAPAPPTDVSAGPGEGSLIVSFDPSTANDKAGYNFYCSVSGNAPADGAGGADSTTDTADFEGFGGFRTLAAGGTGTGGASAGSGGVDATSGAGGTAGIGTGGTAGTGAGGTAGTGAGGTAGTDAGGTTGATGGMGAASGGASGSGSGATSSAGTSSTGSSDCSSSTLVPGADPTSPTELTPCGTIRSTTASNGRAGGLANGTEAVVAVAAVDKFGNVGKLSELVCDTPAEVTGFFEAYRDAGGQAGGGFCSFGPPTRRGALAALLVSLVLGAGLLVRRRR